MLIYPVTLKAIDRFERQNAIISVNVFGHENKDVYPVRISKHEHATCVNLLLIDDGEKQHYCLIKSMSRLCLNSFNSEESLGKHKGYCDSNDAVKIEMLEKGSTLKLNTFSIPFIVYADFEIFTPKLDTAQPNLDESYTKQHQKHTPSGFCYYIKCFDYEVYKRINLKQNPVIYTKQSEDEDYVIDSFTNKKGEEKEVKHELRFINSFKFMASSLDKLVESICRKKYNKAAIAEYNTAKEVVYQHIKELQNPISNALDIGEFDILKDLIDEKNELKKLLANLEIKYEGEQLSLAQSAQRFALLIHKGIYPYDYVDGLEKLAETQLPPKEEFYSKLSGDNISDEDYVHAQKVWKDERLSQSVSHVRCIASGEVFETFRDVCLTNYNLDPAWFYTAPGLAWDAALKLTEVELELISDPDMLLMIEKGIRGGVSNIMTRYGKANNKYMGDEFDPKKDSTYLQYLDANNILGLKITKIHRGIKFIESTWLKKYIDLNTSLRAKSTNDF
ncbi:hypothetical protein MAR_026325 [Mya arenaria]|uniref:Uncharacterized protein n=1 Tax=Mya arenaria TaxID=6604 RepID=A0ABY7ESC3_MYAAR|nr:hypothetical protein MAR_026325 [Mya arenaria]